MSSLTDSINTGKLYIAMYDIISKYKKMAEIIQGTK